VVAPNWIGDALMAQPLIARLRARLRDRLGIVAEIDLERGLREAAAWYLH